MGGGSGDYQPVEAPSWQAAGAALTTTGTVTVCAPPPAQTLWVIPAPTIAPDPSVHEANAAKVLPDPSPDEVSVAVAVP
ncbi:MAG: hypothetical protein JO265_04075 [Acidimicrobiia bacterium]|nr:hypothetical protein [Acidimicrobiia bacterium]